MRVLLREGKQAERDKLRALDPRPERFLFGVCSLQSCKGPRLKGYTTCSNHKRDPELADFYRHRWGT